MTVYAKSAASNIPDISRQRTQKEKVRDCFVYPTEEAFWLTIPSPMKQNIFSQNAPFKHQPKKSFNSKWDFNLP